MKEFFGWGGYTREAEGFLSWQHLLFVTCLMAVMTTLAILLGRKNRNADDAAKKRVLITAAILIDSFELFKIVLMCLRAQNPLSWLYELPLFLCSTMLIAIPLAAFSKGRVRQAALDFVLIFGLLAACLGTYGAGNNYGTYPVLCVDNVISGITHSISGFCALYIAITKMASLQKRNLPIAFSVLMGFIVCAGIANAVLDYNYMFLVRPDGTPYAVLYSLVNGNTILYPLGVVVLFFLYISAFYAICFWVRSRRQKKQAGAPAQAQQEM